MRVLFIDAIDRSAEIETRYRPLWPACLAASARKELGAGSVEFRLMRGSFEREVPAFGPDLVAISSVTQNYGRALRYARLCRERKLPVIVGGTHVSMLPQCISADMDAACVGEGERTFVDLLRLFKERGELRPRDLESVPGAAFRQGDQVIVTRPREPVLRLHDLPHPDRSLTGYPRHSYMFTSRGCPYRCSFCASSRFWGKARFAAAEYVVDEIAELVSRGVRMISFYDDLFVAVRSRLRRIAELVTGEGLHRKARFTCSCRANAVTPDVVQSLKAMNVASVGMGLESGCDRTLAWLKGRVTVEDNERAVNLLKDAGIRVNASFVIGAPDETEEDMMETYRFIRRSRLDFVDVYVLTPLPGTPVWEEAAARGLVSEEMDWSRLDINRAASRRDAVIVSKAVSREQLRRMYGRFRRVRWARILRALPGSPWARDLPAVAWGLLREKAAGLLGRRAE